MLKYVLLLGAVAVMLPLFAFAEDKVKADIGELDASVEVMAIDARFDKTGDGIVDASDWKKMNTHEQERYARESLQALGEDPDALLLKGETRWQKYLQGLRSVYDVQ